MKVLTAGGEIIELGTTETNPTIGITDYSRRVTDDFGVTTVVERGFARRMSVRVALPFDQVDSVERQLAGLRATAATWIADDQDDPLTVVGFYKAFDFDLGVPPLSYFTLTVEGLVAADPYNETGEDPAPIGQPSTLQLLQPVDVDEAVLAYSTVEEGDYPEWSAVTSYAAGGRVILASQHRVYESVVGGNIGHSPAELTGQWLDIGPTNRWAMFDQAIGTLTTAIDTISVTIDNAAVDGVALLDVTAGTVRVQSAGYDRTQSAAAGTITFLDLPMTNGPVTVTVAGPGQVSVGTLLAGRRVLLGVTEASPTAGINDFSRKVTDDFGEVTVVERAWAKRMTASALIRSDAVGLVASRIAAVRARPSLWIGQEGLDSLTIYGFFKDFSIEVGETVSKLALSIEGLSAAAKIAPLQAPTAWPDVTDPTGTKPEDNATVGAPPGTVVGDRPAEQVVQSLDQIVGDVTNLQEVFGDTQGAAASAAAAEAAEAVASTAAENSAAARDQAQAARDQSQGAAAAALADASDAAQSVVDAGGYATAASGQATIATQKATEAGTAAGTATAQADIATTQSGQAGVYRDQAATSATTALGSSNSASQSATISALAESTLFPSQMRRGGAWANAAVGTPEYRNTIRYADNFYLDNEFGTVWDNLAFGSNALFIIGPVGALPAIPGRTYEAEVRVRRFGGDGVTVDETVLQWVGLSADFQTEVAYGNNPDGVHLQSIVTNEAFAMVTLVARYTVPPAPIETWLRPRFYGNYASGNSRYQLQYFKVTDVTEKLAGIASAVAANASSASASASNDQAGQRASAANDSANTAITKAGEASTSAGNAALSASNALGSSNSASSYSNLAASAYSDTVAVAQSTMPSSMANIEAYFAPTWGGVDARPDHFYNEPARYLPGEVVEGACLTIFGTGNVSNRGHLPLIPGHHSRLSYRWQTVDAGGSPSVIAYIYAIGLTASFTNPINIGFGNPINGSGPGWGTPNGFVTHVIEFNHDDLIGAGCAYFRGLFQYPAVTGTEVTRLLSITIQDITSEGAAAGSASAANISASTASAKADDAGVSASAANQSKLDAQAASGTAAAQAGIATSQAVAASSSAAAAATSSTLSAQLSSPLSNKGSTFSSWTGALPDYWTSWGNAANVKTTGQIGRYGFRQVVAAGDTERGLTTAISLDPGLVGLKAGWYVIEGDVSLDEGTLDGAGILFRGMTDQETFVIDGALDFVTEPSSAGITGATGSGTAGRRYSYSKLVDFSQATSIGSFLIYLMSSWAGFRPTTAKVITWNRCGIRPATHQEIDAHIALDGANANAASIVSEAATRASETGGLATRSTTLEARALAGGNLLSNTGFVMGSGTTIPGWGYVASSNTPTQAGLNIAGDDWHPINENALSMHQTGEAGGANYTAWQSSAIPVAAGSYVDAFCFMASHRCNTQVILYWLNTAGVVFSSSSSDLTGAAGANGGRDIGAYRQQGLQSVQVPGGTASVVIELRKYDTAAGQADSYAWFVRPYIGAARAGQTEWNPFAPGSGSIDKIALAARVSTNEGAIATVSGRVEAYSVKEVTAGGASAFISFRAKDDNGAYTSDVAIGASTLALYNQTSGGFTLAMQLANGNALFTGNLNVNGGIRLGNGNGWPVAKASVDFAVEDGGVLNYGSDLAVAPSFTFARDNFLPTGMNEVYSIYMENATSTQATLRAKIIGTPTATNYSVTNGYASGTGPPQQISLGSNPPAQGFGSYGLVFGASSTGQGTRDDAGGAPPYSYSYNDTIVVFIWGFIGGAWVKASQVTLNATGSAILPAGGSHAITASGYFQGTVTIGTNVTAVGISIGSASGAAAVGGISKCEWSVTTASATRSALPAGGKTTITVRPK